MSGSQDLAEKLNKLDPVKAKKDQLFDLGRSPGGRTVTAKYMGGQRWQIIVKKAS